jgi:ADP-ribose pyrophosphatase
MDKFWKILSTKKRFKGEWIDMDVDEIELPDGNKIYFEAVKYHREGAGIAAENENGEIMLVKSYRYINDIYSWEIPAGTVPKDQHHSDTIIDELKEEAGCEVDRKDLKYLGNHYASIGSSNQVLHCYHATNVRKISDDIDGNEVLEARWFGKDEIRKMIVNNEIKDGFSLVVLMRVLM